MKILSNNDAKEIIKWQFFKKEYEAQSEQLGKNN